MRMLGMSAKVDELEIGMNRAAEHAAGQTDLSHGLQMTFDDAARS